MVTYYKAVDPNGKDFYSHAFDYLAALASGETISHPNAIAKDTDAAHYISVSVNSGDCTGFRWSAASGARLFEVKPVGRPWTPHPDSMPNKRAVTSLTVVRELPSHMLFGPQGEAVVEILHRYPKLSSAKKSGMYAAQTAEWASAWSVVVDGRAGRAGLSAARGALGGRLNGWSDGRTAYGAALAVLLRHTIGQDGFTQAHYDALTKPWVTVTGTPAHPDDKAR